MFIFVTDNGTAPRYIINFPTKRHWREGSRLSDIEDGLQALVSEIQTRRIRSIALPPLCSGLGGLDWTVVWPRIAAALGKIADLYWTFDACSSFTRGTACGLAWLRQIFVSGHAYRRIA